MVRPGETIDRGEVRPRAGYPETHPALPDVTGAD